MSALFFFRTAVHLCHWEGAKTEKRAPTPHILLYLPVIHYLYNVSFFFLRLGEKQKIMATTLRNQQKQAPFDKQFLQKMVEIKVDFSGEKWYHRIVIIALL